MIKKISAGMIVKIAPLYMSPIISELTIVAGALVSYRDFSAPVSVSPCFNSLPAHFSGIVRALMP